jgi:SAM-dependent methyltransferase
MAASRSRMDDLFERYYYGRAGFQNGTEQFHRLCADHIRAASRAGERLRILEIGAGGSNRTSRFLAQLGRLTVSDVSSEVLANDATDECTVLDGESLPFPDGRFDACVSNYVLEHIAGPTRHFLEVARVLRPGGVYVFRTPNQWHYVSIASRLTPHAVHVAISNRLRGLPRDAHDPWPTHYRANRRSTLRRLARAAGMEVLTLDNIEKEPSYGARSPLLFFPMMAYERIVNMTELLSALRSNLLGVLRKPISMGGR